MSSSVGRLLEFVGILCIGIALGGLTVYQYLDKKQTKSDVVQVKKDNKDAAIIESDTDEIKATNTTPEVIIKYRTKEVKVPVELTDEEIDTLCINRYAPSDVMQSLESTFASAWGRFNNDSSVRLERCKINVGSDSRVAINCDY